LNTVEVYVPWNFHEPVEEQFNFEYMADIIRFIQLADEQDLYVIVRPSPYICAEWEFGGLPAWLLKEDHMRLRCSHPTFLAKIDVYAASRCSGYGQLWIAGGRGVRDAAGVSTE
jgi:beta-galactosidase